MNWQYQNCVPLKDYSNLPRSIISSHPPKLTCLYNATSLHRLTFCCSHKVDVRCLLLYLFVVNVASSAVVFGVL